MGRYKWVWLSNESNERLFDVGILDDGTLHNPNGYPEDVVRTVVLAADARRHERRSRGAKEAAKTRQQRQQRRTWQIAKRLAEKQQTGPRQHCYICGRHLDDPQSIARGIGSECWQGVLARVAVAHAGPATSQAPAS
jgi:hypothetical protein